MITRIISDSSCELFDSQDGTFRTAPLTISTDDRTFPDDANLNTREMLDYLAGYKGRSYTACPSVESWLSCFEGADVIYVAAMTSALSGTLNSALSAKEIYLQDHPDAKIHIFDTLTTGPELWLFVEKLEELVASGAEFDQVVCQAEDYVRTTRLFFALKSLHNLAANGRINKAVASAIGILGISILCTATEEGRIHPIGKCRSSKKLIASIMDQLDKAGYHGGKVRISHIENVALAESLQEEIYKKYPQADVQFRHCRGLCSYYAERGGILLGCEC